jgi:hypothetical protein
MTKEEIKTIVDTGFTAKDGTKYSFVCTNEDHPEFKILNPENMTSDHSIEFMDWCMELGLTPRYNKID